MPFLLRKTITQTFLSRVANSPNLVGFVYKPTHTEAGEPVPAEKRRWKEVTFREFRNQAELISLGLMSLGIKSGDRVAILSETRFEWSLCDIAILGASAVPVPIYPSSTEEDVQHVLRDSDAKIAIVEDETQLQKLVRFAGLDKIVVIHPEAMRLALKAKKDALSLQALSEIGKREQQKKKSDRFEKNLLAAQPSDLFTICYTTGTTGTPKGALLTQDNLISVLEDCLQRMSEHIRAEKEVLLSFLPFSHVLGRLESMVVYCLGCRQFFAENADAIASNLKEVRPTLLFSVPRVFERSYIAAKAALKPTPGLKGKIFEWLGQRQLRESFGGRLRFAICGGAPLSKEIGEFFDLAGLRILEGYGLTETCAPVTLNDPSRPKFGTVGRPLPEVHLKIAADGEILIQSRKVFRGYNNLPKETAEVLRDGWFHTGDVGFIDSDGFLQITDRKLDLIITSTGKNIAPQKIEKLAKSQPLISEIVVYGEGKNFISALVTLNRDLIIAHANENNILFSEYSELIKNPKILALVQRAIDEINQNLANHEKVRKFLILPEPFSIEGGELTPSLKVRRNAIQKRYRAQLDQLYS